MFSTAKAIPVDSSRAAMPLTKSRGVLLLPAERRVDDDHLGAHGRGHLGGALELAPRLGPPDPLREQQARRVDRAHRDAWCSESCWTAEICWLSASMPTITSTAS